MITQMSIFSSQKSAPALPLGSGLLASNDPVQIRGIDGLGPVKATIQSTAYGQSDGDIFQGASVGSRNIVLTLGLNPNWADKTMSSLRHMLYAYFSPKQWCKMRFFSDDMATVDIEGYVESFEPNIYTQDPEVQISIICPKPDFIEINSVIFRGQTDDGSLQNTINYVGTVPTGFELQVVSSTALPAYTGELIVAIDDQIIDVSAVTVDTTRSFKLSTVQYNKRVIYIRLSDGAIGNLLGLVSSDSVWPVFVPGENLFSVAAGNNQDWTLAFFNRYVGL